jgi:hypothetical protein
LKTAQPGNLGKPEQRGINVLVKTKGEETYPSSASPTPGTNNFVSKSASMKIEFAAMFLPCG